MRQSLIGLFLLLTVTASGRVVFEPRVPVSSKPVKLIYHGIYSVIPPPWDPVMTRRGSTFGPMRGPCERWLRTTPPAPSTFTSTTTGNCTGRSGAFVSLINNTTQHITTIRPQ